MKTLALCILLMASTAFGATQTFTFTQTSSARTTAPNLRIAIMKPVMAQMPTAVQGFVWDSTENYWLTKSTSVTYNSVNTKVIEVETNQDTKVYLGSDLTNYVLIYSGIPKQIILR